MNEQTQRFYLFGEYRIEKTERLLTRQGEVVPLPPKAVELLFVLLENNNHVVTKEELMNRVWADSFVEEANLSRNVFLLRKVLGEGRNGGEKFIETIPRRGYRFAADVAETDGAESSEIITRERTRSHIVIEEECEADDATQPKLEAETRIAAVRILGNLTADEKIVLPPPLKRRAPSRLAFAAIGSILAVTAILGIIACAAKDIDQNGGEFASVVGVDAATGTEKSLSAHRWASINHLSWLRDGSLIVIAGDAPGSPAQIWSLSQPDGILRQLTNDLNSYERLSATANGEMFLSIQRNSVARLSATGENQAVEFAPTVAQQVGSFDEIAWTPDGRIAYFSFAGEETNLWLRNADGSNPRQLTTGMQASRGLAVSPDNRHIVFTAAQNGGKLNLWRTEINGLNLTRLTDENGGIFPTISPDGNWVIYQQGITRRVLQKISLAGGASVSVTEIKGARPQISPDGKLVAFFFIDDLTEPNLQWNIGIVSAEDGQFRQKLTLSSTVTERFLRWTPDGKSIAYTSNDGDTGKIIVHPLDDAEPPRPLTALPTGTGGMIEAFAWSPDGRQFAFTRESQIRDVVLLNNYKETKP